MNLKLFRWLLPLFLFLIPVPAYAAGNPISGIITLENDTAIVTFTSSAWEYIENGTQFTYTRKNSYNK